METDLTSIIIGLASLATFFVPIGIYQHHEKKTKKESIKHFLKIAAEIGFQAGEIEVLRNHAAIGLGKNGEQLLYVIERQYKLVELTNIVDGTVYKKHKKYPASESERIHQIGVRLQLQNGESVNLTVFEGKEGTLFGDERLIAQQWVSKIRKAQKKLSSVASV
jgi:hypothetical protein